MRRKLWIWMVVVLLLAGVAGALAWAEAPRLLAFAIRAGAGALGYQEVRVRVASVGLREATLEHISVGPAPGFSAREVVIGFGPRHLLAGRVASLRVASAELHGLWTEEGVSFPALPPAEEGPWLTPPAFDRLELAEARVELGGAKGPVRITVRDVDLGAPPGARLRARGNAAAKLPGGPFRADVDLVVDGDRVNGHARVRAEKGGFELAADLGAPGPEPGRFPDVAGPEALKLAGRIRIDAQEADLSPLSASFTAKGSVDLALEDRRLRVRSDSLDLADLGVALSALDLDADLGTPPGSRVGVRGKATVKLPAGPLHADADLVLDGKQLNGRAALRNDKGGQGKKGGFELKADLGAPGPGPGRFPEVAGIEDLRLAGRIEVTAQEADLRPFTDSVTAQGGIDLALRDGRLRVRSESLDVAGFGLDLSGLDLDVDLAGVSPPVAPAGQRLSVRTARVGIDVGGGALRFGLERDGSVSIESLDWRFHGGELRTSGRYDPRSATNQLVLAVASVDLATLVAALERPDLRVTGTLDGTLPVRIDGDRIFADGGRLIAREGGGVIHYRPGGLPDPTAPKAAPAAGAVQGVDLMMDALENFHYRKLRVEVDGELTGEMVLRIQIEGSNPDVYEGYPFQLNLNLEGPLADVVQGGTTGFRIQDAVEKRFQERGGKR